MMRNDLIYDVGMNNGDDTAYYLSRGYRVVAVEANPVLVAQGQQRFRQEIAAGWLVILNVGIASESGEMPFWICESCSEWSSFDRRIASRDGCPHHEIMVQCRTMGSIIGEYGIPYYLKIDIEGNDGVCIDELRPGQLPKYVSAEANDVGYLFRLRDLGYTRFKCISQFHFLPLESPPSAAHWTYAVANRLNRSRNPFIRVVRRAGARRWINRKFTQTRAYNGWTFPHGSSGPFGEELPGRWQTVEELAEIYLRFLRMMRQGQRSIFWDEQAYSFWVDYHASCEG